MTGSRCDGTCELRRLLVRDTADFVAILLGIRPLEDDVNDPPIGPADGTSVSIAIVTAVASYRNVVPTELPPLYEWIDPDAVDALFKPTRTDGPRQGRLEFSYAGHELILECDDRLTITVDGTLVVERSYATELESVSV